MQTGNVVVGVRLIDGKPALGVSTITRWIHGGIGRPGRWHARMARRRVLAVHTALAATAD